MIFQNGEVGSSFLINVFMGSFQQPLYFSNQRYECYAIIILKDLILNNFRTRHLLKEGSLGLHMAVFNTN